MDTSWYLSTDGLGVCSLRSCSSRSLTVLDEDGVVLALEVGLSGEADAWLFEYCLVKFGVCFFGIEPSEDRPKSKSAVKLSETFDEEGLKVRIRLLGGLVTYICKIDSSILRTLDGRWCAGSNLILPYHVVSDSLTLRYYLRFSSVPPLTSSSPSH